MYFSAEIVVLCEVPSAIVTLEARVLLKVLGYLVEAGALHSTNGCIGYKKLILVLVDQVAVDLT